MTPQDMAELHARVSNSPWSADSFAQQIEQPNALLAFNEHAFAIGRAILDEAELLQIATDPDHQRQGMGRQVLIAFESAARAKGCARAFLEVAQSNAPAQALYATCGWQTDGRRKAYYTTPNGDREDALLLSKIL